MVNDLREPVRSYEIPSDENTVAEDFARLALALTRVGVDVGGLLTSVAQRALIGHAHAIGDVTGLQAALDGKQPAGAPNIALQDLNDVSGTTGAAAFMVIMSTGTGWQPGVVDAANLSGWSTRLAASSISAAQITGVLDPARIPVLQVQSTIISSGDLTALTSSPSGGQQAQIVAGSHVTTTDGRRWIYSGSGSKTLAASYIELGDVTPEWNVIANKPAWAGTFDGSYGSLTGRPSLGTAAAKNVGTSAGQVVMLDGSAKLPAIDGSQLTNLPVPVLDYQVLTASGTWTKPAGLTGNELVHGLIWGGGAGGRFGGGSGGACVEFWCKVSELGATAAVTIGAGGASATDGGDSSIVLSAYTLTAYGGRAGSAVSPATGAGGAGTLARATGSAGGEPGGGAVGANTGLAGGGGGFGGGGGGGGNGGAGGPSHFGGGGGGAMGNSTTAGGAGGASIYGGGGGGGGSGSGAPGAGGASALGGAGGAGATGAAAATAGSAPGGGGGGNNAGTGAVGARGECRVWVIKA